MALIPCSFFFFRKQGLLCYQGNIFRAEKDNCKNNNYTTSQVQTRSTKNSKKKENGVSDILSKVEQVHIDDRPHLTDSNNTRSRKEKVCCILIDHSTFSVINLRQLFFKLLTNK